MFVYLLVSIDGQRFKIGKAIDIHQRVTGIGGAAKFDFGKSACVAFSTESDAYRVERTLHRFFARWRCVSHGKHVPGGTEYFEVECYERVIRFLEENADLTGGARPTPIAPAPAKVPPTVKALARDRESQQIRIPVCASEAGDRRAAAKLAKHRERCAVALAHNERTIGSLTSLVTLLETERERVMFGTLTCAFTHHLFVQAQSDDLLRSVKGAINLAPGTLHCARGGVQVWTTTEQNGNFLIATFQFVELQECADACALGQEHDQLVAGQLRQVVALLQMLPPINSEDVFRMLEADGVIDPLANVGIEKLKQRLRAVLRHERLSPSWGDGPGTVNYWEIECYRHALACHGVTDDEMPRDRRQNLDRRPSG
jgi:hypothetical protein